MLPSDCCVYMFLASEGKREERGGREGLREIEGRRESCAIGGSLS